MIQITVELSQDEINKRFIKSIDEHNLEQFEMFRKHVDVNVINKKFIESIETCNLEQFEMLRKHVDVNVVRTARGYTPLMLSCHFNRPNNFKMVKILLEMGADPNQLSSINSTAIMFAAEVDNIAAFRKLLPITKNLNHTNDNGKSVLVYAINEKSYDMVKELIEAGVDTTGQYNGVSLVEYARLKDQKLFELFPEGKNAITSITLNVDYSVEYLANIVINGSEYKLTKK